MAIEFINPITAGTTLVRSDIRSQNYVQGSAGWIIKANGDAEFNSVVIRGGTVVSGTALYYNGTPAAGNLFMSISATAGTDSFGNAYVKGMGLYGALGTATAKDTAGNTTILTGSLPVNGLLASLPGVSMQPVSNTGDPGSIGALDPGGGADLGLILTSPSPNHNGVPGTDFAQIYMTGPYTSPAPAITLTADAPGGNINFNGSTMDENGVLTTYGFNTYNTYTPSVGNDGTATYSTRTGWYQRVGGMVFFTAYLVVNNPGSGAGNVTITAPTSIDRTTRQVVHCHTESLTAGNNGSGTALAFNTGSGATFDRIRNYSNGTITGADLLANGLITVEGWYREA